MNEKSKRKVSIHITDNGQGMTQEILEKSLKPFFTTKSPEEGTGLGLFITQWVIQQHGGTIKVDSERGRGTRFRISMPKTLSETIKQNQETPT